LVQDSKTAGSITIGDGLGMEHKVFRILLIDDDEDDYILTRDLFGDVGKDMYKLDWAGSFEEGLDAINQNSHDVCLLDYKLGKRSGLELLQEAVTDGCNVPVILLTGQDVEELDIQAIKSGAVDFLNKKQINAQVLERSVRYAIERRRSEERILRMAFYDSLTHLPNRALFHDRIKQMVAHALRTKEIFAVLFLDLDNFKRINDTFDHRIGDLLLKGVADRLVRYVRLSDTVSRREKKGMPYTVARLGGDEFILLLSDVHTLRDVAKVSQRILTILNEQFMLEGNEVYITTSIGISVYPENGKDTDTLLKNADIAMYHAKDMGKNNFQFYEQTMNESAFEKLNMENSLRKAIERNEFILHYQPRMDLRSEKIVSTEALIRWEHPEKGLIYPSEFIPIAEETGIILQIGEWVLKSACKQCKVWRKSDASQARVSVSLNLSGKQFSEESLVEVVARILKDYQLDPHDLELEITESVIMKNAESTVAILNKLKTMGVQLSMDDFGTGYSSFNYLKRFPLDNVKIDRSFIRDIANTKEDAAIVKAIIAMAHSLKLKVVAEGVETDQQLEFLREQGCDEIQGFLLSVPLPDEETLLFLKKNK
jgi:diguanylate cyclase (GGDEF)-like protein